ncbi:MAG: UDP-N-acetylmuramoyl-L-alanyl-D-glutamate--2,6-diaminopimelate ligase [Oscillospiraceae bacterium]|nr:UDP-N-acetylmuramoyl-L-alanyl-D-glutamate--2,6-diaminopimelate ligase [Oscillospiraceae bacterium]
MKLEELLRGLKPLCMTADPLTEIGGISYDSRKTEKGDLFVAVRGFETDGHRYISKALEKGAAAILCEEAPKETAPYVQVADTRLGLALCSAVLFGYPAERMRMIGITGTSGKTSVSTILKHVLEECLGARVGLIGTNGIFIGSEVLHTEHTTPESYELQRLFRKMYEEGCSHVVMEVSSHALELSRVAGIRFQTAVYTNLSQDHLDFHGNMENYARAKQKLFHQCEKAVINLDDGRAQQMLNAADCPVLRYGLSPEADLRAEQPEYLPDRVRFQAVLGGEHCETELHIPGSFSVSNALAVMAAAVSEGIGISDCAAAMKTASGVKGRLESVPTDGDYRILIDYSHKPDALEKVLKSLRPATKGRLICLFGCGGDRDRLKRPQMGAIATRLADLSILTSDNPRTEDPEAILDEIEAGVSGGNYLRICDRREAIRRAIDLARSGDVILLAGKGQEDYQIIGHEKHHMDEREIVADCLNERKMRK